MAYPKTASRILTFFLIVGVLSNSAQQKTDEILHSSIDGLFAIQIPATVKVGGGGPLEREFTDGFGSSYSTFWRGPSLYLQTGYVDFSDDNRFPDKAERNKLFLTAIDRLKKSREVESGLKLVTEQKIPQVNADAVELAFEGPAGTLVYRLFSHEKGIVRVSAAFSTTEAKSIARRFLDSLTAPSREQIIEFKVKEATPSPLPECPGTAKITDDRSKIDLIGPVKTVDLEIETTEKEKSTRRYGGQWVFDQSGQFSREMEYQDGKPYSGRVYGCIDGRRVYKSAYASYENQFSAYGPSPQNAKPRDPRYTGFYEVNLDSSGRIIERRSFGNNEILYSTTKFTYSENKVESESIDDEGVNTARNIRTFNQRKQLISEVNRHFGSSGVEWRNTYSSTKFDKNGNWIERNKKYEMLKNDQVEYSSTSVERRVITYYQ